MIRVEAKSRCLHPILWMGCGVFALGLASFMLSGLYSRFLADDYCKAAHFILYGFWNGQVVAWHILAGRFMVTFLTGVFDYFGTFFYRLTPALVICLWVVELSVLLLRLQRFLPFKLPAAGAWLCGMLVTLSSMVGAPSRLQSLYWRDGMFNYNFPILFFLLLLITATAQLEKQRQSLARPSSDPRQTLVRVRKPQGSEVSGFGSLKVSKRQPLASLSSDLRQTFVRFRKPQGSEASGYRSARPSPDSLQTHARPSSGFGSLRVSMRQSWRLWFSAAGCASLAFFAAGCSESFAAYEIGFFIIVAGLFLFSTPNVIASEAKQSRFVVAGIPSSANSLYPRGRLRGQALHMLAFSLAGALAGLALIWLSPDTAARQKLLPASPDFFTLVFASLRYAFYFMRTSTNLMKLVTVMTVGIPAVLVFYLSPRALHWNWRRWLLVLGLILLAGYAALVPLFAPSVYAESSDPESRVLIIARFSLVCTFLALGVGIGLLGRQALETHLFQFQRVFNNAALLILAGLCLYSLVISWQINAVEIPARQAWAAQWDQRDALLRAAAVRGQAAVHVVELQSMGKLMEYGPDPNDTLNICVAQYYGLKSVIATPP